MENDLPKLHIRKPSWQPYDFYFINDITSAITMTCDIINVTLIDTQTDVYCFLRDSGMLSSKNTMLSKLMDIWLFSKYFI